MYLAIKQVEPLDNFKLKLLFSNGEKRIFDSSPYLNLEIFKPLKDKVFFRKVKIKFDTIEWPNEADFDPEFLYEKSELII
jgi:hypothetical protein